MFYLHYMIRCHMYWSTSVQVLNMVKLVLAGRAPLKTALPNTLRVAKSPWQAYPSNIADLAVRFLVLNKTLNPGP